MEFENWKKLEQKKKQRSRTDVSASKQHVGTDGVMFGNITECFCGVVAVEKFLCAWMLWRNKIKLQRDLTMYIRVNFSTFYGVIFIHKLYKLNQITDGQFNET